MFKEKTNMKKNFHMPSLLQAKILVDNRNYWILLFEEINESSQNSKMFLFLVKGTSNISFRVLISLQLEYVEDNRPKFYTL